MNWFIIFGNLILIGRLADVRYHLYQIYFVQGVNHTKNVWWFYLLLQASLKCSAVRRHLLNLCRHINLDILTMFSSQPKIRFILQADSEVMNFASRMRKIRLMSPRPSCAQRRLEMTSIVYVLIHPFDDYVTHTFWSRSLALISKLRKVIGSQFMRARLPGQMT
jgi:hypothetical protein